ncbi:MAG: transposase zinc-binding domain-containing protein [Oligoflexia bacterium]|nr:transposase zinc-binding domain-containing protein [Oligoflexia bacterium]
MRTICVLPPTYERQYGVLRDEVLDALDKYLSYGILLHGCARAVCEVCHHSELIAFSCKT